MVKQKSQRKRVVGVSAVTLVEKKIPILIL